ncbi:phosphoglucosamine mutase [Candidatus Woesearchaeota archaeon]|nr:phosphoglucosamine mutase [Candidatus Woesearchaeota archaeon]
MKKLFGTDGVRGKANTYPMTAEIALKLGMAAGKVFSNGKKKPIIVIGKDTRISGYMIEYAITAGLTSMGVDVLLAGPMPTPAIAHLVRSFAADAGIVISASHNPAEDNGIKFFDNNGFKLLEEKEKEIERLALSKHLDTSKVTGKQIGKAKRIDDAQGRYIEFVKGSIQSQSLKGIKIILDCANGAAYKIAPLIFQELGAEVIVLNNKPDGMNINKNAGCIHPEILISQVKKENADIGIALDGDADRVLLVDEKGEIVDGDEIIAIWTKHKVDKDMMKNKKVVSTVMSNLGFEDAMKQIGVRVVRTAVGDKYVSLKMREIDSLIGGEQSGHIIFSRYSTTGDGVISALQILKVMKKTEKKLSDLKKIMEKYPQILLGVNVKKKKPIEKMKKVKAEIDNARNILKSEGRILVRYSGTENKCRVMVEGKDAILIKNLAKNIATAIKKEVGA